MSGFGGGISSFIQNKAEYMVNENIQFDVVTYDECPENFKEVIHQTGGSIYTLKNPKLEGWQAFKESFVSVLKNNIYDIIHCHINGYRILPYYYYAKKHSKASFYVHAHSSHPPKFMLSKQQLLKIQMDQRINRRVTDKIVGCGTLSIKNIFGQAINEEEIMVIPNSVEVSRFVKNKETADELRRDNRNKFHIKDDEILIGHVGRLESVKNHELTIKLGQLIKEKQLKMKILIIGSGNREDELKSLIEQKDLDDVVTFTGRISPIEDFYPALDVLILPSFAEGLPTVVVEAQAAGVPVVMSDTITKEVDLGFNMVQTAPIDKDLMKWIQAIENIQTVSIPEAKMRKKVIIEKNFSNEASADLYAKFLRGEVTHYTIISPG